MIQILSGTWLLARDSTNVGREERWFDAERPDAVPAPVPGIVQQVFPGGVGVFWYYRRFALETALSPNERALLRFGAVDYLADIWLNGRHVGSHEGGETPFDLDISSALRPDADNLIAARVLVPCNERIDGILLAETPHRNKTPEPYYQPGSGYDYGGIVMPVTVETVPAVRIVDLNARPDCVSGAVEVAVTLVNDTESPCAGRLRLSICGVSQGPTLAVSGCEVNATVGASRRDMVVTLAHPHRWDLDDPFLYRVTVELECSVGNQTLRHDQSLRVGFRDFRVVGGFFHLNGRRILLRSTHTGNHYPIGQVVPQEPDLLRRDFIMAKAVGYNMVRSIVGMLYPQQLDFCDEIGLMVYEESMASWCLADSADMPRRYDFSVREMIQRDRNHACITIWGMLNETTNGAVFRHAVDSLALARSLDRSRLVLLSSGRWDGRFSIGSVSNPGGDAWEAVWGSEGAALDVDYQLSWDPAGAYVPGAGDAHIYPLEPQTTSITALIRNLGANAKPVFLSEYGFGSQFNAIDELKPYDRFDVPESVPDRAFIRSMAERLAADFTRFGMDEVYPFTEDFLRDSYRHMVSRRRLGFDCVRSNPSICGYNVTGMLDHALTGEGIWTFWRNWKPGVADMMHEGFAPLRWCLFVDPLHAYAHRPLRVEAVLANENMLGQGEYPVTLRIVRPGGGTVWERRSVARIPACQGTAPRPLAVPVFKETVDAGLPAGDYVFGACLERGGTPAADRLALRVSDTVRNFAGGLDAALVGVDASAEKWLADHGLRCHAFAPGDAARIVLVGDPPSSRGITWESVRAAADAGATVVFLSARPFLSPQGGDAGAPLGEGICAFESLNWLYHKDFVAKRHPVFEGLQANGLLDFSYYGQVIGPAVYACTRMPDDIIAAAFAVGYCCPGGYQSGIVLARYRWGRGNVVVNSLRLLENLDRNPVADRLMANIIRCAQGGMKPA